MRLRIKLWHYLIGVAIIATLMTIDITRTSMSQNQVGIDGFYVFAPFDKGALAFLKTRWNGYSIEWMTLGGPPKVIYHQYKASWER